MSKCDLTIRIERADRKFHPGEQVRGEVTVRVNEACRCNKLTLDHRWRAHGKGNRTQGDLLSFTLFEGEWSPGEEHRFPFEVPVPDGPATWHGSFLNVDHYLMARADIPWALDPKAEADFLLIPAGSEDYNHGPLFKPAEKILNQGSKAQGCVLIPFGSIFALMGLTSVIIGLAAGGAAWVAVLVGGLFMLVGLGIILGVLWKGIAQKRLGIPEVKISRSVARPGERISLSLRVKPRQAVELAGIHAELKGEEVVVSGSGTNAITHRNAVHQVKKVLDPPGRTMHPGESADFAAEFEIPADAGPTFAATDNSLAWSIHLSIGLAKWPDWTTTYPITIRPAAPPPLDVLSSGR